MPKRFVAILFVAFVGSLSVSLAEELQPGVQYIGETTLESSEYGTSFVLPAGWIGMLPQDSDVFVMQSQNFEAYAFAGLEEMTVQAAQGTMGQAIDVGQGVVLHPAGGVEIDGSVLAAEYSVSGSQAPLVGRVMTIVGEHGLGFSVVAVAGPENSASLQSAVRAMIASVSLGQPQMPSASSPPAQGSSSHGGGPWVSELTGRKLSHFFTRSGYTEEDYIWLCPNGRFFKSFNSGGFGGGASGALESKNAGSWSASGSLDGGALLLTYNDGSTATYALTHEGTKLFLDGKRYFRETADCN